ncbi:MAG: STAS domain-containing protein [Candidatus Omnitrophica bacterium]|nr:STAS domain-containing protein [Candidatus Omnitrophota bacterium]
MKILINTVEDVSVVILEGELNVDDSIKLRESFLRILKEGATEVMVDFEKVSFIGSAGLATLIEMMQLLRKAGGKLGCCNINDNIRGLFEITKVHKLINIYESRAMALRDF